MTVSFWMARCSREVKEGIIVNPDEDKGVFTNMLGKRDSTGVSMCSERILEMGRRGTRDFTNRSMSMEGLLGT